VRIEELGLLSLYRLSSMINLEVAFSETHVCFVLMPSDHEVTLGLDPLDLVEIIRVVLWEVERNLKFGFIDRIRPRQEYRCCNRRSNTGLMEVARLKPRPSGRGYSRQLFH
jgi:hypothetical protein